MSIDFLKIRSEYSLIDVVSRYVELVRSGSEFRGLCPFHDDTKPSLTIYRGNDGFERYRCFSCDAGIEGGDVIDFIAALNGVSGVEACKILNSNKLPDLGTFKPPAALPDESGKWTSIIPVPDDAPRYDPGNTFNPKRGRFVHYRTSRMDTYRNVAGKILCHVVRLDFDNGHKTCPTITYCSGLNGEKRWCAKRMSAPYPLMGLDDLAKRKKACVMLVSGEKCRERAAGRYRNFVVITWLGGDQAVQQADIGPLVGRDITFWQDADKNGSGKRSMIDMFNRIERHGTG